MRHHRPEEGHSMIRRLFTLASALSLILCLAMGVLWVRSYRRWDGVLLHDRDDRMCEMLTMSRGRIQVGVIGTNQTPDLPPSRWHHESDNAYDMARLPHELLGLGWGQMPDAPPWYPRPGIQVPHSYVAFILAILPALRLHRFVRSRRRANQGLCSSCGYDLRASPERCPECGTPAAKATA
jgi:hypothetical protein